MIVLKWQHCHSLITKSKDLDQSSSAIRDIKSKYYNSVINKRIGQAVLQRESHSGSVERRVRSEISKKRDATQTISPCKTLLIPNKLMKNKSVENSVKSRTNGFQVVRTKYNTNCNVTNYNTIWRRDSSVNSDNPLMINKIQNMNLSFDDTLKRMLAKKTPMVGNPNMTFSIPVWQNPCFKSVKKVKNKYK